MCTWAFVAKCRRDVFTKEILDDMFCVFASVCQDSESELVEFDEDDLDLLVNYHLKVSVSLVTRLKGVPSRMIRQKKYRSIQREAVRRCVVVSILLRPGAAIGAPPPSSCASTEQRSTNPGKGRLRRPRYPSPP